MGWVVACRSSRFSEIRPGSISETGKIKALDITII